jgi:RNA polymerase sigma-70 factor (ECF subfamily)
MPSGIRKSDALSVNELVRNCQRTLPEDTRCFEKLVAQSKSQVYRTAYRLMGNRQDAEDQAQEVFLKVYRHIRQIDDPATFPSWLYQTTINTCLDALRRSKRTSATTSLDTSDEEDDPHEVIPDTREPSPQHSVELSEIRDCIENSLAKLDDTGRAIIVMRDLDDHPYEEIARVLGIGLSAVKMRIHRTRIALQKLLRQICPDLI